MPASADPLLPSLSKVFRLARPGTKAAMIFLYLILCFGITMMAFQAVLAGAALVTEHHSGEFAWQYCWFLDTAVLVLCVYQTRSKGRSWILPGWTFGLIAVSLVLFGGSSFAHSMAGGDIAIVRALALLHAGIQVLAAGAVLALRRIAWLG